MRININDLSGGRLERDWVEPVEPLNEILSCAPHNTTVFKEPLSGKIKLVAIGNDIDIRGNFEGRIEFECDRCCEMSEMRIREDFHYVLMPKPVHEPSEKDEAEEEEESTELSYYEGDEIHISPLLIEQILLSVPIKLLCKEDCKGICTGCGASLNIEKCKCKNKTAVAGPFKKLKQKQKEF